MTEIARIDEARRQIEEATDARQLRIGISQLVNMERHMREAGLYDLPTLQEIAELKAVAVAKLGRLLASADKSKGGDPSVAAASLAGASEYRELLDGDDDEPRIAERTAQRYQKIATLPEDEREKVFARAREEERAVTLSELELAARPYAAKESRQAKHKAIHKAAAPGDIAGPYSLIYADPPWTFEIYSEKGKARTPDQHYPTLTDEEIMDFTIGGKTIIEVAHDDATLLLWCTSSNIARALNIMGAWGFVYKSQAVWVKDKSGLGLVFRNKHEVLLYGTRGKMPGPQHQPISVFEYPRGRHSAKPPEIRAEIEQMYPDFDESTRLELFAREAVAGWSNYGYEASNAA